MSEPFIAEIRIFPYNFAPRNWAFCDGQLQAIAQNTALFSLIGTFYGGNGVSTFGLPDLRGRTPLGIGQGPGLTSYDVAEQGGAPTVTLTAAELPMHTHTLQAAAEAPTTGTPTADTVLAGATIYNTSGNLVPMAALGASAQPHNNRQPFLTLNFCICLLGVFPARN